MQPKHLIFFDSSCFLCKSSVEKIIKIDRKKIFCFAPLTGITAKGFFKRDHKKLISSNSLVLVENFSGSSKKIWIRSQGFFRILWLIGGRFKSLGIFYLLPSFLTDWAYKIIANHRHKLFKKQNSFKLTVKDKNRFLP